MSVNPGVEPARDEVESEHGGGGVVGVTRPAVCAVLVRILSSLLGGPGLLVRGGWSGDLVQDSRVFDREWSVAGREPDKDDPCACGPGLGSIGHFTGHLMRMRMHLQERGGELCWIAMRSTKQRRAIFAALTDAQRPLGPREVLERAAAGRDDGGLPGLNLATVYRNLNALLAAGQVVAVDLLGQPPRYELSGLAHHHHFLCDRCDRLYDIPGCPGAIAKLAPRGFEVTAHELILSGVCDRCR